MDKARLARTAVLTHLDWTVVEIARRDGPRSITHDGLVARLLRGLFGFPAARRLASERAEALRRFCVRAWHLDFVRRRDVRSLIEAGYSIASVRRILAYVAASQGVAPSPRGTVT